MDRPQGGRNPRRVEHVVQPRQRGVPLGEQLIGQAAVAELVFDLARLLIPVAAAGVAEGGQHGVVGEVELLDIIFAVEKLFLDELAAPGADAPVQRGALRFTDGVGHPGGGVKRGVIEPGQPRIRAEEFDVQRVMLAAGQHAGLFRVPPVRVFRAPSVFQRPSGLREPAVQPVGVAGNLPLPVHLDHAAHLPVDAGAETGGLTSQRQLQPEAQPSVRLEVPGVVQFPHRPLQRREQKGQRVGVVPDVGAASLAAAVQTGGSFESVEFAVLQPQAGRALQHREIGGNGVDHRLRQGGREQRVVEKPGLIEQPVVVRHEIVRHLRRAAELRGVPVAPAGILAFALVPEVPDVRPVPGEDEADLSASAGRQRQMGGEGAGVVPVPAVFRRVVARLQRAGAGEIVPEHIDVVLPFAAVPAALAGVLLRIGDEREFAVAG